MSEARGEKRKERHTYVTLRIANQIVQRQTAKNVPRDSHGRHAVRTRHEVQLGCWVTGVDDPGRAVVEVQDEPPVGRSVVHRTDSLSSSAPAERILIGPVFDQPSSARAMGSLDKG